VSGLGDAVYAVNCGGEAHTDIFGIRKDAFSFQYFIKENF
jgi:hypothetical protein